VLFKIWWVGSVVLIMGLSAVGLLMNYDALQGPSLPSMSSTELSWNLMYLLLAVGVLIIHCTYVLMG